MAINVGRRVWTIDPAQVRLDGRTMGTGADEAPTKGAETMARFLGLITLSEAGAKHLVDTGLCDHRDFLGRLIEKNGGTLESMWVSNVGDWDLIMIVDVPEGTAHEGAAATLMRRANGQHAAEHWVELVDIEATDSALRSLGMT